MGKIDEIMKLLELHKEDLRENFAVKKIGIFGSFARGDETEKSDVDVYVEFFLDELDFDKYLRLIEYLEGLFGRKVDIITKDGIETMRIPYIKKEIKRSLIYA